MAAVAEIHYEGRPSRWRNEILVAVGPCLHIVDIVPLSESLTQVVMFVWVILQRLKELPLLPDRFFGFRVPCCGIEVVHLEAEWDLKCRVSRCLGPKFVRW